MGMSNVIEIPNSTQILEIKTEDFVGVISILTCHGYRITAQRVPGRHVVEDEMPQQPDPPSAA
jgi:hypothetical protein